MSGHNPHGRSLGQPNSSWNQLQVPSYIPRQPQLAHMSNERQIVRSPPTWHTPTPSDSLFSFMAAANHKVPLESGIIKPLIPPFVAPNMPPFGSVDLSISAARNSLTPSPRSLHSPGITSNLTSTPPVEFSNIIKNNPNSGQIRNLSPTPGVIQTAASVKEKQHQTSSSPSLLMNNGDLNAPGLFIRDAKQINNDLVKITREPIGLPPMSEPVELVKEAIFHSMVNHSLAMSPTRNENHLVGPIPTTVSSPASPEDNQNQHHVNQESSMNVIQSVNSQSPSYSCNSPTIVSSSSLATVPLNSISASASIIQPPISPPSNNVSEDSIDSNGSKKRRKRKPNKTIRMSSDSNDNNSNLENNSNKLSQNNTLLDDRIVTTTETAKIDHPPIVPQFDDKRRESPVDVEMPQSQLKTIVNPTSPALSMLSSLSSASSNDKVLLNSNNDNSRNNNNNNSKLDADECETIDKIAEMIAKTDKNKEILLSLSTTNKVSSQTDDADLEKTLNGTISCDNSNILTENTNSFEDVENKLEEMFAGLVDDRPAQTPTPQQMIPKLLPSSSIAPTISSVIKTGPDAIMENHDAAVDTVKEVEGECLNNSGINDNLKILGLNNTTDDDDKHENSGDNNNIMNEVKLTENDKDDTSAKLVNNSISNIKNSNNSNNNNNRNSKGTKRGKLEDSNNLGDPINKKKKKNNSNTSSSSAGAAGTLTFTPKTTKNKTKLTNIMNNKTKSSATKSKSSTSSSFNRKPTDLDYNDRDDVSNNNNNINSNSKSFRGPFVHVRPDGEIAVINAPNVDEDTEKSQNKLKKITGPTSSERNQIRGLHVSTLSMKYDADTRDTSWICVFCKIGPHKNGLGDLFGPYILTTTCEDFQLSQLDPAEDLFKSKRTKQDMIQKFIGGKRVDVSSPVSGVSNIGGKKKKKPTLDSSSSITNEIKSEITEINIFDGMSKAGENSYEIWTHEDCVVWAPGVHIIGSRIVGLEAAVWSSSRHKCVICSKFGAMLSCLYRGCSLEVHVPCAKQSNWTLNDNDFKCYCDKHKITLNPQT